MIFLDLETGGLDPARNPITQIGAIAVDADLNEMESFEAKIDFDASKCDADALAMSSYDPAIWEQESKPAAHVIYDLTRFLKRYADVRMVSQRTGSEYFVAQLAGYNAATFDGPFLQAFYKAHDAFLPAAFRVMCVLQRVLWHFNEHDAVHPPEDFKLGTVCRKFGIDLTDAHDALADCRATVALCRALTQQSLIAQQ